MHPLNQDLEIPLGHYKIEIELTNKIELIDVDSSQTKIKRLNNAWTNASVASIFSGDYFYKRIFRGIFPQYPRRIVC